MKNGKITGSGYMTRAEAKRLADALRLTDEQVMGLLRSEGPYQRARAEFSKQCGKIEQASAQRQPLSPIELRRMEFEAVDAIVQAAGLEWSHGTKFEPKL